MKIFNSKLWEKLMVSFLTVLVIVFALTLLANAKAGTINSELRIETYKIVTDENNDIDTNYWPAVATTAEEVEALCREACESSESEGLVLLKNDNNALPLAKGSKASFLLSGSSNVFYATHGPGRSSADGCYSFKDACETTQALQINETLFNFYLNGDGKTGRNLAMIDRLGYKVYKTNEPAWSKYSQSVKDSIQAYGDVAIFTITIMSGEGDDVSAFASDGIDGSYLTLTQSEIEIFEKVAEMKRNGMVEKIVVLLNSAVPMSCEFLFDETLGIDAAMWIGCPGGTGTISVVKALVGDVNPSGRVSDTFLKDNFASPVGANWKVNDGFANVYTNADELNLNATQKYYGVYQEGIYVGYRYFETRYEDYVTSRDNVGVYNYNKDVAFPFGYGLSYTTFEYSNFQVSEQDGVYKVTVTVKNAGTKAGKEVVQIYGQKPYTEYDYNNYIEKASVELMGFAKTNVLEPNATQTLEIEINKELFKSYDSFSARTYILDAGKYYLTVAKNSHDAINNILSLKADGGEAVTRSFMDDAGNSALAKMVWENPTLDTTTYSVSTSTGVKITNQLDYLDPNMYEGFDNQNTVTYVSRADWVGTFPTTKIELAVTGDIMKYDITSHKPIVEDGSEMPTFGASNGLTLIMLKGKDYNDEQWDLLLDEITLPEMEQFLTGCIGVTPAIPSINKPLTDEDDGPYGVSHSPYGYSSMPSEGIIASTFNTDIYTLVGKAIAADARIQNLHGLYATGLNIHRSAFCGRNSEYYSEDPVLSGIASMVETKAIQAQGVITHTKHFIFNDEESKRNGICIWLNEQAAREIYLLPWEYTCAVDKGNSHAIMTSFNRAGLIWTSASDGLMNKILRDEWGFDGYALTDMADSNGGMFMTYDDGFMNGTDCFLGVGSTTELDDWTSSPTYVNKLRTSTKRMLYNFVNNSAVMNGIDSNTKLVKLTTWWEKIVIALNVVSITLAVGATGMFVASLIIGKKH